MSLILDIAGLRVSLRRGGHLVRDVSLQVATGQVHGLVGESGAGKTMIAKAVLGILPDAVRVSTGSIGFKGTDLLSLSPRRFRALLGREIAMIPQDPLTGLNPSRRIVAQMTDTLRHHLGQSRGEARGNALRLLQEVQIRDPEKVLDRYPHELSGGMRQRVLIAMAFATEPSLIIADEPTTALDVTVQKQILRLIRQMQERHGTAVLFVTHDLGVVAKICHQVTVLHTGQVVEQGSIDHVMSNAAAPFTRALMAATPRYDQPADALHPVPEAVHQTLRDAARTFDGRNP
ncbi:MAG: ABC transporter ATP-binding protein [Minwuia sp.]|nr:ABC transporter ATP-binding protein [Minwuia sp.]